MSRVREEFVLLTLMASACSAAPTSVSSLNVTPGASLLVTGVIVVDPATATTTAPQDILIENGRIARMAPAGTVAARSATPRLDGSGRLTADPERASPSEQTSTVPVYVSEPQFRTAAQAIVNAFAEEVRRARGNVLATPPAVEIRNTPQLIFFGDKANTITVPWWETQPGEMRGVFRTFAGGGETEAEHLFRAFFNRFLIAHEAGHWFQARAGRRAATLYDNENMANRIAVAFWRTQPDGERFLAELERLAVRAVARLSDPTPAGEDPVAYFGANYQALGRDPLKYGFYQFRFMADALRERSQLDWTSLVAEGERR